VALERGVRVFATVSEYIQVTALLANLTGAVREIDKN
jgi:hypothetical protein